MTVRLVFVFAVVSLLSIIFLNTCSHKNNPSSPNDSSVIMPLAVGNYWVYADSDYSSNSFVGTFRYEILGKTIIQFQDESFEVFWGDELPRNFPDINWLMRNESDGLYEYGGMSKEDTLIIRGLSIKFPAAIGEEWPNIVYGFDFIPKTFFLADTILYSCVATNERFDTKAGTFDCYVYKWCFPEDSGQLMVENLSLTPNIAKSLIQHLNSHNESCIYYYYAPNVGLVGIVAKEDNEVTFKRSLLEFSLDSHN